MAVLWHGDAKVRPATPGGPGVAGHAVALSIERGRVGPGADQVPEGRRSSDAMSTFARPKSGYVSMAAR